MTLDGDIDFQPPAVSLLVDLMKKNKNLGAACGRIHPVGSGPMVWYQLFEYAIGKFIKLLVEKFSIHLPVILFSVKYFCPCSNMPRFYKGSSIKESLQRGR